MSSSILDFPFEVRSVSANSGEFEGYASVFGVEDSYGTVVEPGAFSASLSAWKQKGRFPAMLWQHKIDEPVGVYTEMTEDAYGLKVKGNLLVKDDLNARRAHSHLKAGSINGLSIGFIAKRHEYDSNRDVERLLEIDLVEVSLVTFPSNPSATITNVRQSLEQGEIPTPKNVEKILRDAGFSRSQAKSFMARGYSALSPRDAEEETAAFSEFIELISKWSIQDA